MQTIGYKDKWLYDRGLRTWLHRGPGWLATDHPADSGRGGSSMLPCNCYTAVALARANKEIQLPPHTVILYPPSPSPGKEVI